MPFQSRAAKTLHFSILQSMEFVYAISIDISYATCKCSNIFDCDQLLRWLCPIHLPHIYTLNIDIRAHKQTEQHGVTNASARMCLYMCKYVAHSEHSGKSYSNIWIFAGDIRFIHTVNVHTYKFYALPICVRTFSKTFKLWSFSCSVLTMRK